MMAKLPIDAVDGVRGLSIRALLLLKMEGLCRQLLFPEGRTREFSEKTSMSFLSRSLFCWTLSGEFEVLSCVFGST